eukprot:TRINITY_DN111692_c0_g1_i1.p1 TRINITY_DN111692_c0_g1~~TRINITY_DN111692_c0_g1_i1.p1  ORF type:complete len:106 (-),score=8.69 TRINITY_DN111692_c0_g1_i1:59-376(-)
MESNCLERERYLDKENMLSFKPTEMKAIIPSVALILLIFASPMINAQTKVDMSKFSSASYRADWEEIDSLEKKRLPKSALSLVEKVVEKARRDNNPSQLVKQEKK